MSWLLSYRPPQQTVWQGRQDAPNNAYIFQIIELINLQKTLPNASQSFALLGFASDLGVTRNLGRQGAKEGPTAIRQALAKMAIHRTNIRLYDAGDIIANEESLETAQLALAEAVSHLLKANITPILLGGGHEIAWGHFQGIANYLNYTKSLGIINFDAHLDMRPLLAEGKGSSGTPFLQIANALQAKQQPLHYACIGLQPASNTKTLLDTANAHQVHMVLADAFSDNAETTIQSMLQQTDFIYLTLCLDVFSASAAPGVSAPQPLGLQPRQVLPLYRKLAKSHQVLSYDIAELCPPHDIDNRTAKLAAQFIYEIIHYHHFIGEPNGI